MIQGRCHDVGENKEETGYNKIKRKRKKGTFYNKIKKIREKKERPLYKHKYRFIPPILLKEYYL